MGKKRTPDTTKQIRGSILEAIGKVTGDAKVEAQGVAEKSAGKAGKPVSDAPGTAEKRK